MNVCDLHTPAARLRKAVKLLQEEWAATQVYWNDDASTKFEAEHLAPLLPTTAAAVAAIDRLAQVFDEAERQCQ